MDDVISQMYSLMGMIALVQAFMPPTLREWVDRTLRSFWDKLIQTSDGSEFVVIELEEMSCNRETNVLYKEVEMYLSSLRAAIVAKQKLKVFKSRDESHFSFILPYDEALETSYQGARVWWTHKCVKKEGGRYDSDEERSYSLKFHKSDRDVILPRYFDHVSKLAKDIEHKNSQRFIFRNCHGSWDRISFKHPATFDTLALDDDLAVRIKADLDSFAAGEEYYHKNGRAWKRGYLLFGPPGTGKSSMIAAIANYLKFDIYDLELTKVTDNSELKYLLIETERRSIIVIEDIDCTVQFQDRKLDKPEGSTMLTLSGLLNFADGLWSCCGEERILIFTTNHKDRLDPALLRSGRMDMHISLSYCTFGTVKTLVFNYLGIHEHQLLPKIQEVIEGDSKQVTPAAVAELLLSNQNDPEFALKEVMAAFQLPVEEEEEAGEINGGEINGGERNGGERNGGEKLNSEVDSVDVEEKSPKKGWKSGVFNRMSRRKRSIEG